MFTVNSNEFHLILMYNSGRLQSSVNLGGHLQSLIAISWFRSLAVLS